MELVTYRRVNNKISKIHRNKKKSLVVKGLIVTGCIENFTRLMCCGLHGDAFVYSF